MGRELGWQQGRRGPWVSASPCAIAARQLCLFSGPAHWIVMLKRSQQHWSPEQCPEFLLQPLALPVPSAQGEKQWQNPKQHWEASWCILGNSLGSDLGPRHTGLVGQGCRVTDELRGCDSRRKVGTKLHILAVFPCLSWRYFWSHEAPNSTL